MTLVREQVEQFKKLRANVYVVEDIWVTSVVIFEKRFFEFRRRPTTTT